MLFPCKEDEHSCDDKKRFSKKKEISDCFLWKGTQTGSKMNGKREKNKNGKYVCKMW